MPRVAWVTCRYRGGFRAWDWPSPLSDFGSGRPRWGDYGAAAGVGGDIWIAQVTFARTCNLRRKTRQLPVNAAGTRGALGNGLPHISKVAPLRELMGGNQPRDKLGGLLETYVKQAGVCSSRCLNPAPLSKAHKS